MSHPCTICKTDKEVCLDDEGGNMQSDAVFPPVLRGMEHTADAPISGRDTGPVGTTHDAARD